MAINEVSIPIPARLRSAVVGGHVAGADQIIDDATGKTQDEINTIVLNAVGEGGTVDEKIEEAVGAEYRRASMAETGLNNRLTPVEEAVGEGGSINERIDNSVNTAKTQILGGATEECNTLGKAQNLIATESVRATTAEYNINNTVDERLDEQEAAIALLDGHEVVVVEDHTAVSSPDTQIVYREEGSTSYSDWMYTGTTWRKIATYTFPGIDSKPTPGSNNLTRSGAIYANTDVKRITKLFVSQPSGDIFNKVCKAIKEIYIIDYDVINYNIILQVVRKRQVVDDTYYTADLRIGYLNKTTGALVKYCRMDPFEEITPGSQEHYDFGDGLQLINITSNHKTKAWVLIDWNELDDGDGYGAASTTYKLTPQVHNLDRCPIIKQKLMDSNQKIDDHMLDFDNPHNVTPEQIGAAKEGAYINDIKVGSYIAPKENGTIILDIASPQLPGLMSPEDKSKLNRINDPGDITIEGSGITKNANAYGFVPGDDVNEDNNTVALQRAIDDLGGGGTILIDYPGTYRVNDTIKVGDNTTLIFGANVYINLRESVPFLMNKGATSRTYNTNISIIGLNLISNGRYIDTGIRGLRGYVSFFYVKNLVIDRFKLLDGGSAPFSIHICTFDDIKLTNIHIEGNKDAIHLGRGRNFLIRDCKFSTGDDPLAFNARDYSDCNPEFGWIENGLVENVTEIGNRQSLTGYFCRMLAGGWLDWETGHMYWKNGDACVDDGKIYITEGNVNQHNYSVEYESINAPSTPNAHTEGDIIYPDYVDDNNKGLGWRLVQDTAVVYNCGCRNITFRDIYLRQARNIAFNMDSSDDMYTRCFHPGSTLPSQDNIAFDNVNVETDNLNTLIVSKTPNNCLKINNSKIKCKKGSDCQIINLTGGSEFVGSDYPKVHIVMSNITFRHNAGDNMIIHNVAGRPGDLRVLGSVKEIDGATFRLGTGVGTVEVLNSDITISVPH